MKKIRKILTVALAIIMSFSVFACNSKDAVAITEKVDYSDSTKQFNFFGYSSLSNGSIIVDGNGGYDTGMDLINKENIKDYFDSGLNYILPQSKAQANSASRPFETSKLKEVMDICHELGKDKSVMVTDSQIYSPYNSARSAFANETNWENITVFGSQSWQFSNEAELDSFIKTQLEQYCFHPAFQGVFLPDEPHGKWLKVIGELYKSLRRVQAELGIEDMFINANLLPITPNYYDDKNDSKYNADDYAVVEKSFSNSADVRCAESYRRYLERFLEQSGAEYLTVDTYPLSESALGNKSIYRKFILNLQIMAEVAKKHNAKIIMITQTTAFGTTRKVSYDDLNYLINIIMGFGAVDIGFFTYYTHDWDGVNVFDDNGSMVTSFGDKTPIYYYVQQLTAKAQKLAPTILNFDYKTSNIYANSTNTPSEHIYYAMDNNTVLKFDDFAKLTNFSINKESAVVTELYDDERDNYMYMVINSIDPSYTGSPYYQTAKLTFSSEYNKVNVFFDGEFKAFNLDETNSITLKMKGGQAHYVIPFKG